MGINVSLRQAWHNLAPGSSRDVLKGAFCLQAGGTVAAGKGKLACGPESKVQAMHFDIPAKSDLQGPVQRKTAGILGQGELQPCDGKPGRILVRCQIKTGLQGAFKAAL